MEKHCKVIFLEDINGIIKIKNKNGNLFITSDEEIKEVFKGYAIAVLKEDNRIKELIEVITVQEDGCNRYTSIEYQQFSFKYHSIYPIIATTDTSLKINKFNGGVFKELEYSLPNLSQQFIEDYIKEYNKGNVITEVEVEYESKNISDDKGFFNLADILNINPDNTINIKPTKDSWSREEVKQLLNKFSIDCFKIAKESVIWGEDYPQIVSDKWIEQNM